MYFSLMAQYGTALFISNKVCCSPVVEYNTQQHLLYFHACQNYQYSPKCLLLASLAVIHFANRFHNPTVDTQLEMSAPYDCHALVIREMELVVMWLLQGERVSVRQHPLEVTSISHI